MSATASQIDSFSSSSSNLPTNFPQIESFRSSLPNNPHKKPVAKTEDHEIPTSNTNPWKKIDGSHTNDLMGSSWPALSNPHEICSPVLEKECGAKDFQTSAAHSTSDNISKDNECEKFVSSSVVSSCAMDPLQKLVTVMEKSSENSSSIDEGNSVSPSRHKSEEPSNIIKKTLSVNVGNEDRERKNGFDYGRTAHHTNTQQRSFNSRLKQKPKVNQNQSNYSGFQNHKTSNRHQQSRPFNDKNTGWKQNNYQPVSSPNHMSGYINGFVGLPQPPSSPYAYSHFTPVTNPPSPANVPFLPLPYSIHPQTQYPGYILPMGFYESPYFSGGLIHHPQTSQTNDFQGQDANLYYDIRHQIEYYFSDENLSNDFYLRNHMDAFGWVSVDLIAAFNKVKRMTKDVDLILKALQPSQVVEIQGNNIRKRINWKTWILPNSLINKFQNIQLDLKSETKKLSVEARRVSEPSSEY